LETNWRVGLLITFATFFNMTQNDRQEGNHLKWPSKSLEMASKISTLTKDKEGNTADQAAIKRPKVNIVKNNLGMQFAPVTIGFIRDLLGGGDPGF
jgi:hypothetical protein